MCWRTSVVGENVNGRSTMSAQIPPLFGESPGAPSLRFERRDGNAIATIDRSAKCNGIDVATSRALAKVVVLVEADELVRVAILTASGCKAFSRGANLEKFAAGRGEEITAGTGRLGGLVHAQRRTPWIAAVRELATGGGTELTLARDLTVAGKGRGSSYRKSGRD
jgi:enoyl-CoA hydratase/carnithine racemase